LRGWGQRSPEGIVRLCPLCAWWSQIMWAMQLHQLSVVALSPSFFGMAFYEAIVHIILRWPSTLHWLRMYVDVLRQPPTHHTHTTHTHHTHTRTHTTHTHTHTHSHTHTHRGNTQLDRVCTFCAARKEVDMLRRTARSMLATHLMHSPCACPVISQSSVLRGCVTLSLPTYQQRRGLDCVSHRGRRSVLHHVRVPRDNSPLCHAVPPLWHTHAMRHVTA
jgi:hypothetical protein